MNIVWDAMPFGGGGGRLVSERGKGSYDPKDISLTPLCRWHLKYAVFRADACDFGEACTWGEGSKNPWFAPDPLWPQPVWDQARCVRKASGQRYVGRAVRLSNLEGVETTKRGGCGWTVPSKLNSELCSPRYGPFLVLCCAAKTAQIVDHFSGASQIFRGGIHLSSIPLRREREASHP